MSKFTSKIKIYRVVQVGEFDYDHDYRYDGETEAKRLEEYANKVQTILDNGADQMVICRADDPVDNTQIVDTSASDTLLTPMDAQDEFAEV